MEANQLCNRAKRNNYPCFIFEVKLKADINSYPKDFALESLLRQLAFEYGVYHLNGKLLICSLNTFPNLPGERSINYNRLLAQSFCSGFSCPVQYGIGKKWFHISNRGSDETSINYLHSLPLTSQPYGSPKETLKIIKFEEVVITKRNKELRKRAYKRFKELGIDFIATMLAILSCNYRKRYSWIDKAVASVQSSRAIGIINKIKYWYL